MNEIRIPEFGVYAVSSRFEGMEGEVCFSFRGQLLKAEAGISAFSRLEDAFSRLQDIPPFEFMGMKFQLPVILLPEGVYEFGRALTTVIPHAAVFLGEQAGINPNVQTEESRKQHCSRMHGLFYYGTLVIPEGLNGTVVFDGLALDTTRIRDQRSHGKDLGLVIRNCTFEGALTQTIVSTAMPDDESDSSIEIRNCRLDGFDSLDDEVASLFTGAAS